MNVTRRQLLQGALTARVFAQVSAPAPLLDRGFARVTQIADGVWATIADPSKGLQCGSQNGGVLAGRDQSLIVEGHFQPAGAALEIEAARAIGKGRIRAAVNTHFHYDHTFGNHAYAQAGIPILAHEKAVRLMKEQYGALQGVDKAPLLSRATQDAANASDATDRAHKQDDLEKLKQMYEAIDGAMLAYPTELLRDGDRARRFDLGGLAALVEYHPGHTPTDFIVRVPDRDIVFTGDLLFYRAYPVCVDADMIAWRKVLERFSGYGRRTQFVPGHGPVCGQEAVREHMDIMDDLRAHAEKMIRQGATAAEAERRYVVPKAFQAFRLSGWALRIGGAMQSYYRGLGRK